MLPPTGPCQEHGCWLLIRKAGPLCPRRWSLYLEKETAACLGNASERRAETAMLGISF